MCNVQEAGPLLLCSIFAVGRASAIDTSCGCGYSEPEPSGCPSDPYAEICGPPVNETCSGTVDLVEAWKTGDDGDVWGWVWGNPVSKPCKVTYPCICEASAPEGEGDCDACVPDYLNPGSGVGTVSYTECQIIGFDCFGS